jgi:hypothetical protein
VNVTRLAAVVSDAEAGPCRLCGGGTVFQFTRRVLGRWPVGYWRCDACGSLQTGLPHWLSEAYADPRPRLDTGMVARTLRLAQIAGLALRAVRADGAIRGLDWGGGNGLFCRMMRDQGYDFVGHDAFAMPFYNVGFDVESLAGRRFDVVTSFEVFEHLATPAAELAEIAALRPSLWIFSTQLYRGQDDQWDYLATDTGRHVFFYSRDALAAFARRNGLIFAAGREAHCFLREGHYGVAARGRLRRVLDGGKLVSALAAVNFFARQRRAHFRWQADRERLRAEVRRP